MMIITIRIAPMSHQLNNSLICFMRLSVNHTSVRLHAHKHPATSKHISVYFEYNSDSFKQYRR